LFFSFLLSFFLYSFFCFLFSLFPTNLTLIIFENFRMLDNWMDKNIGNGLQMTHLEMNIWGSTLILKSSLDSSWMRMGKISEHFFNILQRSILLLKLIQPVSCWAQVYTNFYHLLRFWLFITPLLPSDKCFLSKQNSPKI
jgi:hypothetical protein